MPKEQTPPHQPTKKHRALVGKFSCLPNSMGGVVERVGYFVLGDGVILRGSPKKTTLSAWLAQAKGQALRPTPPLLWGLAWDLRVKTAEQVGGHAAGEWVVIIKD